jgi:CheY-like chemotaxis protein
MGHVRGRILLVDDEPTLLKLMSVYLTRLGYAVTTADTTDLAWQAVEAAPAEFVAAVLDGSMPGMQVTELASRMLEANPSLCVVAASGYPMDISNVAAAAPGRVDFLLKPFTGDKLAEVLRRMLAAQEEGV